MKMYKVRDVAMMRGVSPSTVRVWIARGWLPATRVGPRGRLGVYERDLAIAVRLKPCPEPEPVTK